MLKSIGIFLASSSSLAEQRRAIEVMIGRENKRLKEWGLFLDLVLWEDLEAQVQPDGSQNAYNRVLTERCDALVVLVGDKLGQFTRAEFDVAHASFLSGGKPRRIYVFFDERHLAAPADDGLEDGSPPTFLAHLRAIGYYPMTYVGVESLLNQLKAQLEKMLASDDYVRVVPPQLKDELLLASRSVEKASGRFLSLTRGAALAVLLAGLGYLVSPYLAILKFREAVRAADASQMDKAIDWPSVKRGLKEDIGAVINASLIQSQRSTLTGKPEDAGKVVLGTLAQSMAQFAASAAVDGLLNASNVALLISAYMQSSDPVRGKSAEAGTPQTVAKVDEPASFLPNAAEWKAVRYAFFTSIDEFELRLGPPESPGANPITILMKFQPFSWKAYRIGLPPEAYRDLAGKALGKTP